MPGRRRGTGPRHFAAVSLIAVVGGRCGRHAKLVTEIFSDLQTLNDDAALQIDLAEVKEKKANLRSALHRAAKKRKLDLCTTSDEGHLYVFRRQPPV
jgi:hypothetical protein